MSDYIKELLDTITFRENIYNTEEKQKKRLSMLEEQGVATSTNWVSSPYSFEYLPEWKDIKKRANTVYKMLASDATISALKRGIVLPIISVNWSVSYPESAKLLEEQFNMKNKTDMDELIKFVEYNLLHMNEFSLKDFIREALNSIFYGFYIFEIVYKYDKEMKKYLIHKLSPRPPQSIYTWKVNDKGEVTGVIQESFKMKGDDSSDFPIYTYIKVTIPFEKLIVFSFDKEGNNYEGMSILRPAYKHWKLKDLLYKLQSIGLERYSVGTPVVRFNRPPSEEELSEVKKVLRKWRSYEEAGLILKGDLDIYNIMGNFNAGALEMAIRHHDVMIAKSVLAQFLNLVQSGYGSRALSENQSDLFLFALNYIADFIADTINKQLIPKLIDINYGKQIVYPILKHDVIGDLHVQSNIRYVSMLVQLIQQGVIEFNDSIKELIYKKLNLPMENSVKEQQEAPDIEQLKSMLGKQQEENNNVENRMEQKEEIANKQKQGKDTEQEEEQTKLSDLFDRPLPESPANFINTMEEEDEIVRLSDEDIIYLSNTILNDNNIPVNAPYIRIHLLPAIKNTIFDIVNSDEHTLNEIEDTIRLANPYRLVSAVSLEPKNTRIPRNASDEDRLRARIYSPTQVLRTALQFGSILATSGLARRAAIKHLRPILEAKGWKPAHIDTAASFLGGLAASLGWGIVNNLWQYGEYGYRKLFKPKNNNRRINTRVNRSNYDRIHNRPYYYSSVNPYKAFEG